MREWMREVFGKIAELRRLVESLIGRVALYRNPRQTRLAVTVADPYSGDYPCAPANTFWVIFVDGSYPDTAQGVKDWTIKARQEETEPLTLAMGIGLDSYVPKYTLLLVHFCNKQWWFQKPSQGLVRFRLEQDHPGYRGAELTVAIGTQNEDTHGWLFTATSYDGIDWHHDGPYPEACAQGYGQWEIAEALDAIPTNPPATILHAASMDCLTPGCDDYYC